MKNKSLQGKKVCDKLIVDCKLTVQGIPCTVSVFLERRGITMPIGVIINALSVAAGGVLGALFGHKLPEKFNSELTRFLESAQWEWELVPPGL